MQLVRVVQVTLGDQGVHFTAFEFEENTWYHVGLAVQRKSKEKRVGVTLVVNGLPQATKHCSIPPDKKRRSKPYLGCPPHHAEFTRFSEWQLGPFFFYESTLTATMIQSLFHLGPEVRGFPLWNAAYFSLGEVVLTNNTLMDRVGGNVESNLEWYHPP